MSAPTWHLEGCPNETNAIVLIVLELPRVIGHGATRQSPVCTARCQVQDLSRSAKPPMARMAVPEPPKVHVKASGTGPRRSTMLHMVRPIETPPPPPSPAAQQAPINSTQGLAWVDHHLRNTNAHPPIGERSTNPRLIPKHNAPGSGGPTHPEVGTVSSDSTDSHQAQLCSVNQRMYEVQMEFRRSKEELRDDSLIGSSFVQEI
ncbi:hypothetical protein BHE74_00013290 [Ensete ventricosum]|nr:hypothetical protein BHE74_00013290 [Ensete ventricosum]